MCKYPEKTRRRKEKLGETSLEFPAIRDRPSRSSAASDNVGCVNSANQNGKRVVDIGHTPTVAKKTKITEYSKPMGKLNGLYDNRILSFLRTQVTRPHNSAASLLKPFKTPFKVEAPNAAVTTSSSSVSIQPIQPNAQRSILTRNSDEARTLNPQDDSQEELEDFKLIDSEDELPTPSICKICFIPGLHFFLTC